MPNKKKKNRKKPQKKIPVLTAMGALAGVAPHLDLIFKGQFREGTAGILKVYTGYNYANRTFDIGHLKDGLLPLAIGALGSIIASKLGINRRLSLPFIKA